MRIYNGTNSQLNLPLSGIQRISIAPKSVSGDIMPSNEFLSLLVGSFDYSEIALIVSGPYEISMCAGVSGSVGFVVQSLEEAIERFAEKKPEPEAEVIKAEVVKPIENKDDEVAKVDEQECVSFCRLEEDKVDPSEGETVAATLEVMSEEPEVKEESKKTKKVKKNNK